MGVYYNNGFDSFSKLNLIYSNLKSGVLYGSPYTIFNILLCYDICILH